MKHCADYVAKDKVKVMNARLLFELRSLLSGRYFENIECFSLVHISGLKGDLSFLAKVLTPSMHEEPAICYGLFYFDCTTI
jgi:hypothetical protein